MRQFVGTTSAIAPSRWEQRETPALADLDSVTLRHLARTRGYDATIELLHQAIRASPLHGPFIREVESQRAVPARPIALAIVPGALYREHPETGADGRRFVDCVRDIAPRVAVIPVRSLGSLAENAAIITRWMDDHPPSADETLVLVSISKGSADVKAALLDSRNHAAFRHVRAWISIGGLLHGSPLINWLRTQRLRQLFIRLWLFLHGYSRRSLSDLAHGPGTPLDVPTPLPEWMQLIHLIALPTPADLSTPLAHRAFGRLLPLGPNDGGGLLLGDLARFPGLIYPLHRTDHYLRDVPQLPQLLIRLLQYASQSE